MARERLVGSFLVRFTEQGEVSQVRLQDLRTGAALEFETWVAAWAYIDEVVEGLRAPEPKGASAME